MKKFFLSAVLILSLSGAAMAAPEGVSDRDPVAQEVIEVETVVAEFNETPENETIGQAPAESNVAKKMTQAEKAHNAEVNDSWGGAITIVAMLIVISALAILSVLFLCFGKISEKLLSRNKRKASSANATAPVSDDHHEPDSGEVIAAIALALTEHFQGGHDYEDTILTIRRMKRAYSPWNSKIYNLRHIPDLHRNGFGL